MNFLRGIQLPRIGMWGLPGAGKTTFAAALYIAAYAEDAPWRRDDTTYTIVPTNDDAEKLINDHGAGLTQGIFPPATDPDADPSVYEFDFAVTKRGRTRKTHLSLIEAAGGHVLDPDDRRGYFKMLQQCSGVMMMIDPELGAQGNAFQPIFLLLTKLHKTATKQQVDRANRLLLSLAICITKSDIGTRSEDFRRDPDRFLKSKLGPITYNMITSNFANYKPFAVSAVGRVNGVSNISEEFDEGQTVPQTRIRDMNHYMPMCLFEPILWLSDPTNPEYGQCREG